MSTTILLIPRVPSCSVLAPFWPVISSGRHPASLTEVALESAVRLGGVGVHCFRSASVPYTALNFSKLLFLPFVSVGPCP